MGIEPAELGLQWLTRLWELHFRPRLPNCDWFIYVFAKLIQFDFNWIQFTKTMDAAVPK